MTWGGTMRRSSGVVAALAGLLGLAGLLTGCSGGDAPAVPDRTAASPTATAASPSSPAPATLPDPCTLVSAADLEQVSGVPFGEGMLAEDIATATEASCVWEAVDGPLPIVQVLVVAAPDQAAARRESTEEWMGTATDVEVAGATDAYAAGAGTILGMQVGDVFVEVSYMSGEDDVTAIGTAIAEVVAGSL
ncbi:DUF3558 family protein [Demequina sp. SYSU T00192]|uniref:DUF3558 family protein n=1 Tax=Demequina litoralis TaxID=3051660 RepID=A0ABT8G9T1_9MICO|nr:DUF3558 family protein [Demequina sp. SYSU T00192]MDN4475881.1 DUF3558 family protein [Demequina sp. SYSU T00192]